MLSAKHVQSGGTDRPFCGEVAGGSRLPVLNGRRPTGGGCRTAEGRGRGLLARNSGLRQRR